MTSLTRAYARIHLRRMAILLVCLVLLATSLLADVANGPAGLDLATVLRGLLHPATIDDSVRVILWDIRLPYAVMAVLVGAALGLAGAEMQTGLGNPLASPMTLGITAAATLGAALAVVFGVGGGLFADLAVGGSAFVCAAACALVVQLLARVFGGTTGAIVLFGIVMSFAINALVSVIQFIADAGSLQQIVFWSMGSLARADWTRIALIGAVLAVCLPWSLANAWAMTALCAGEEQARALGIAVERLRMVTLLRASLLAAIAVAFVGAIGFIGLVAPHLTRLALGEDHRYFLPGSALTGALVLSLASIASKAVVPGLILPVGIVTALIGVPLFLALILLQRSLATTNLTSGLGLRGLACGYRDKLVLDNLNVPEIAPGSLVALVGANAAGKSTLLRTLACQLAPLAGEAMLGAESLFALPEHHRRKLVGYLPQTLPLGSSLYAWEAVLAASRATRSDARAAEAEIEALFHRLGLAHIALRRLNQLSGGQRQLVGLAQLIVRQPQVLLLDEPTSALDPRWQLAVFDIVREEARQRGALALLAIHDLNLALRFCDRVLVLSDGQLLADGPPGEAMTPAVLRAAYHIEGRVERCSQGGTLVVADKALPLAHRDGL